jgi:hypothetical protein
MRPTTVYARPSSAFGYWRGGGSELPLTQGQGSGMGQRNQGAGIFPPGSGDMGGGAAWSPTLTYMLIFAVIEIVAFGLLGRMLR